VRILHVIHSIDPRSGGPSHALRVMVREQAAAGNEVSLLSTTTQSGEPWAPRDDYVRATLADRDFENIELSIQPAFGRRRPWSRYAYSPSSRRFLEGLLPAMSGRRPDVVHIHGLFSHVTGTAARASRHNSVPYVIRPAGGLDPWCLEHGNRQLKRLMLATGVRTDLRRAAFVQAMSRAEEEHLGTLIGRDNVVRVPHGCSLPELDHVGRGTLEEAFPQLRGSLYALFLGRIHEKKRPELVVEAAAWIRDQIPDLKLVFAGHDDGGLEAVRACVHKHGMGESVIFTGFLKGALKSAALAAAEVFVLPSRDENFGVAVIEAMAHATPVLVTPGVASHEFVGASGCGLTVDGTPEALGEGLKRLLAEDREELGRRGRRYVERHLTWAAVVAQLDEVYQLAIENTQQACPQPLPIG
jgi:glycosyltransferase involved in cell wall biosynthesis